MPSPGEIDMATTWTTVNVRNPKIWTVVDMNNIVNQDIANQGKETAAASQQGKSIASLDDEDT